MTESSATDPAAIAYDDAAEARHRALRQQFLLRPDVVFLNHGSFGACPRPVFERYQAWQLELEQQPVEFIGRRRVELLGAARASLASYLNCDADEVVYAPNVTAALNIVARSLPLSEGDEILSTDHEYGALDRTWKFVCERTGARYVVQKLPYPLDDPDAVVEAVMAGLTPRTKVLFLSHITSPTAVILPIEKLIARAKEAGLWTVIDGAHAPGQIPVDVRALGVDFYGGNCHKWLSAPKGAGFLYARRELQPLLQPLVVSWGWQARDPSGSPFVDENEFQGTIDFSAYLSVPAAIEFQAQNDWDRVRAECHELVRLTRAGISELTGLPPLAPDSPAWFAQLATIPLPPGDEKVLKRRLYDEYRIEIPIVVWRDQRYIRVSVQGYNTREDIERLVDAVGAILQDER
ncbi:MAG: aminotransferase class V-fold PLP-dependent enzyme [Chloroflexota bacterium]